MRKYKVTLNVEEGDFLIWGPPYWSDTVRAINADHAARMVAIEFQDRQSNIGEWVMATHKCGDRATVKVGTV